MVVIWFKSHSKIIAEPELNSNLSDFQLPAPTISKRAVTFSIFPSSLSVSLGKSFFFFF